MPLMVDSSGYPVYAAPPSTSISTPASTTTFTPTTAIAAAVTHNADTQNDMINHHKAIQAALDG